MEILSPDLIWIEERCYRLPNLTTKFSNLKNEEKYEPYQEPDSQDIEVYDFDISCDSNYEITETKNRQFSSSFHVPRTYLPFLIGTKGATRKRIESETRTQLFVPKQAETKDVIVIGYDKKSVQAARRRIDLLILSSRQKLNFTHFVSIPMTNYVIKYNFAQFQEAVLSKYGHCRGVDASIFQTPDKLHLTIATLVLVDDGERKNAGEQLAECKKNKLEPLLANKKPIIIKMNGIEYMNDDPAEVDVLYGKVTIVDDTNLLQTLCNTIVQYFDTSGYLHKSNMKDIKLHVTLMNTNFRSDKSNEAKDGPYKKREQFDASGILKEFQNFGFGECVLDSIQLSQRHSTGSDGYYQATAVVNL